MEILSTKKQFLSFTLSFLACLPVCYSDFPVSKTLRNIHRFLSFPPVNDTCKIIRKKNLAQRHNGLFYEAADSRNYFSCCFVFKLSRKQKKEIEVPLSVQYIQPDKLKLKKSSAETLFFIPPGKVNCVFTSGTPINEVQTEIKILHVNFRLAASDTQSSLYEKNLAMLLSTLEGRTKDKSGQWRKDVLRALRITDSEAKAIFVLQHLHVIDNIINAVCETINTGIREGTLHPDTKITSIDFHGYTTRDMCGMCFTNMNIIQYLSNQNPYNPTQFSFLAYLKYTLTQPITDNSAYPHAKEGKTYAILRCPTRMFISSSPSKNSKEDISNLNFPSTLPASNPANNTLHQFRIIPSLEQEDAAAAVGEPPVKQPAHKRARVEPPVKQPGWE